METRRIVTTGIAGTHNMWNAKGVPINKNYVRIAIPTVNLVMIIVNFMCMTKINHIDRFNTVGISFNQFCFSPEIDIENLPSL